MIDTIADAEGISMASVSFKAQFGKGSFFSLVVLDSGVLFTDIYSYIVILSNITANSVHNIIALTSLFVVLIICICLLILF